MKIRYIIKLNVYIAMQATRTITKNQLLRKIIRLCLVDYSLVLCLLLFVSLFIVAFVFFEKNICLIDHLKLIFFY